MDGQTNGRTNKWMGERTETCDGWTKEQKFAPLSHPAKAGATIIIKREGMKERITKS